MGSLLTRGVQPCMDAYRFKPQRPQNTVTWCICHVFYISQNLLKYHVAFERPQQRSEATDLQAMKYLLLTAKDFVGHDLSVARSRLGEAEDGWTSKYARWDVKTFTHHSYDSYIPIRRIYHQDFWCLFACGSQMKPLSFPTLKKNIRFREIYNSTTPTKILKRQIWSKSSRLHAQRNLPAFFHPFISTHHLSNPGASLTWVAESRPL